MPTFWARMGGVTVSDAMVLLEAKLGRAHDTIEVIARRKVAAAIAWEQGITASERDVEERLAEYYRQRDLPDVETRRAWRERRRLKEEAIRSYLREMVLIERLRARIVTDDAVGHRYRETLGERRLAEVDLFSFSSEAAANGFISAVQSGEMEARLGERHRLPMSLAPQEIAADLAGADEGQLVGPVAMKAHTWHVYRFLRWDEPPLDARLKEAIREELFQEALAPTLKGDPLVFLT